MENIINGSPNSIDTDLSISKPSVLDNARKLVHDKTRFEPDEIQPVTTSESWQPYEISVQHSLDADPVARKITGHFVRNEQDINTSDPNGDAAKGVSQQLREAASNLRSLLGKPNIKYNQVVPGMFLIHPHKYWNLYKCSSCGGLGKNICGSCSGQGEVTCYRCSGSRKVHCYGAGCIYGKVNCYSCGGNGYTEHSVPYQTSTSVYVNGSYKTQYHTAYKTERRNCYSCVSGKINCSVCAGAGRINCPNCRATGKLTCSGCGGEGYIQCSPCEGSGAVGEASWVDVRINQEYAYNLPEGTQADVMDIAKAEGVEGLPEISNQFGLLTTQEDNHNSPSSITATYNGTFHVVRQDVICVGENAHLVAYGNDLRWWSLDGIIERLLEDDLKALFNAVEASASESLLSTRLDHLLESLKHVVASEINVGMVEAALSKQGGEPHRGAVSAEYAANLTNGIQDALRRIYVRRAKNFAWQTTLATMILGLSTWAFLGVWWAAGVVCTVLLTGFFLHRRAIRNLLTEVLGTSELALRAMSVAGKGSGGREAAVLMALPSLVLAGFLAWVLPAPLFVHKGPAEPAQAIITTQVPAPAPAPHTVAALPRHKLKHAAMTRNQALPAQQPETGSADAPLDATNEMNLQTAQQMYDNGVYRTAYALANSVLSRYPHNARAAQLVSSAHEKIPQDKHSHSLPSPAYSASEAGASGGKLNPIFESQLRIAEIQLENGYYQKAYDDAQIVLAKYPSNERATRVASAAQLKMGNGREQ
jgi:hypothetical protein